GMGAAEGSDEVGREDGLPALLGHGLEPGEVDRLARRRRAGVVDEDVEAAELVDGSGHHLLRLAGKRDIAGRGDDAMARRLEARDLLLAAWIVGEMVQRHHGAAAREELDRGEADA